MRRLYWGHHHFPDWKSFIEGMDSIYKRYPETFVISIYIETRQYGEVVDKEEEKE